MFPLRGTVSVIRAAILSRQLYPAEPPPELPKSGTELPPPVEPELLELLPSGWEELLPDELLSSGLEELLPDELLSSGLEELLLDELGSSCCSNDRETPTISTLATITG